MKILFSVDLKTNVDFSDFILVKYKTNLTSENKNCIYIKIGIFIASGSMNHLYNKSNQATVNGHKYSSPSIEFYLFI
jgi:retron-type reverse transcriptase